MRVRVFGVLVLLLRLRVEWRYRSLHGGSGFGGRRDGLRVVDREGSKMLVVGSRHDSATTLDFRLLHA